MTTDLGEPSINPWQTIAPPCPHCGEQNKVWLWHPEGKLRWYCSPCKRRFDVKPPKKPQKRGATDPKVREALLARDSAKFPQISQLIPDSVKS